MQGGMEPLEQSSATTERLTWEISSRGEEESWKTSNWICRSGAPERLLTSYTQNLIGTSAKSLANASHSLETRRAT